MPSEGRGILSPVRLPVPPLQQAFDSFEFTTIRAVPHCGCSCGYSRHLTRFKAAARCFFRLLA